RGSTPTNTVNARSTASWRTLRDRRDSISIVAGRFRPALEPTLRRHFRLRTRRPEIRSPPSRKERSTMTARANPPKIFYTNTVEYWGGGRVAALVHTSPEGARDLNLPANERVYFLTGSQHGPAAFPPAASNGQQKDNPTDYWWAM